MPNAQINITPKRSVSFFAFLSIFMVGVSYLLLLLLAVACIYLPYLLLLNTQTLQMQVILLFLGGIAVASTMLWSLLPRRDKFDPPGPLLDRSTQPKLFREIDKIAGDRKSTRLNSSHLVISYAVFCLKKKKTSRFQPLPIHILAASLYLLLSSVTRHTTHTTPTLHYYYIAQFFLVPHTARLCLSPHSAHLLSHENLNS